MSIKPESRATPKFDKDLITILLEAFPEGVIGLDLETTGLSPLVDKIIEISAVKLTPGGISYFDQLIDPKCVIPQKTIDIHGIQNSMVEGHPKISEVLPSFFEFTDGLPLIAHNAQFDLGFLVFNIHQAGLKADNHQVYCSCKYARSSLKNRKSYKLSALASELGVNLENHHRALDDSIAGLEVFGHSLRERKMRDEKLNLGSCRIFQLSDFSSPENLELPKNIEPMIPHVAEQELVVMKYKGGTFKNKWRPIQPIALLPLPSGNILYAKCLISEMYKSFALSKIKEWRLPNSEDEVETLTNTRRGELI
ncbi:MAG: 3'-5' exonuclease [Bacteriovoracaceae bacterium]|nr:3'-5' exonuclease [Bacteriovoracaceae bacterium]